MASSSMATACCLSKVKLVLLASTHVLALAHQTVEEPEFPMEDGSRLKEPGSKMGSPAYG